MADPVGPIQSQQAGSPSLMTRLKANLTADPAGPMQYWKTVFLFFYLVIAGLVAMYFAYGLWAAEPQPAQLRPAAEPSSPSAEKPADGTPQIKLIDPQAVTIATGQVSIRVLGPPDAIRWCGPTRGSGEEHRFRRAGGRHGHGSGRR
jgi:hypothetical protein